MRIDLKDYGVGLVGSQTLDKIIEKLEEYKTRGIDRVVVDFRQKGISTNHTVDLARLVYKYNCKLEGIGNKEYDLEKYLTTGYFIKEEIGRVEYATWIIDKIEDAGYPFMIRDNRFKKNSIEPLSVIKPYCIDGYYMYYYVLKPAYLEPKYLEAALKEGKKIVRNEKIEKLRLGDLTEGYRFAGTLRERYILDVFQEILEGKLEGFIKEV